MRKIDYAFIGRVGVLFFRLYGVVIGSALLLQRADIHLGSGSLSEYPVSPEVAAIGVVGLLAELYYQSATLFTLLSPSPAAAPSSPPQRPPAH